MTNPHRDGCFCVECFERIDQEALRGLLRSCLRTPAPESLRLKIVLEVRQLALTWRQVEEE